MPFAFKGDGGTANNLLSRAHCNSYCGDGGSRLPGNWEPEVASPGCPRGSPLFQKDSDGGVNQFAQRRQLCDPTSGCGEPNYECLPVRPGRALCCPTKGALPSLFANASEFLLPFQSSYAVRLGGCPSKATPCPTTRAFSAARTGLSRHGFWTDR